MSQGDSDRLLARVDLYEKLREAEALEAAGEAGIAHGELMKWLRQKLTPASPAYNSRPDP